SLRPTQRTRSANSTRALARWRFRRVACGRNLQMDRSEARQTHGAVTRHGLVCVAVAVSACATLIGACRPPSNTPPVADDSREPRAPSANGVILNPPNRAGLQRVSLP